MKKVAARKAKLNKSVVDRIELPIEGTIIVWDISKIAFLPMTKNGFSREVPLTSKAVGILADHAAAGMDAPFPYTVRMVQFAWKRTIHRVGVDDLHFHDLRHEAISRLFEKGLTIPEVAVISYPPGDNRLFERPLV